MMTANRLTEAFRELGYEKALCQRRVGSPASKVVADVVAFTQDAPQDLRTSAIAGFTAPGDDISELLSAARLLATPFALIERLNGTLDLYEVKSTGESPSRIRGPIAPAQIRELRSSKLATELAPRAIRAAKAGMRQLTLFPIDARLLVEARSKSVDSISARMKHSFHHALEEKIQPTSAARLVIESLAAAIVRDKYQLERITGGRIVDGVLTRHGEYFENLARWQSKHPELVESTLRELGDNVDYSAIDARTINAVYEELFLTSELRSEFGIYHTDQRFASRILDHLPIEEIPPEDRYVVDPACGAGNLLLAAQERLENISPGRWSARTTHDWLKTHMYGADIEPIAVEIAKLSLLVSSLPLGNSWQIEQRDSLEETPCFGSPPTIWVTNPPWQQSLGSNDERAIRFLDSAIGQLADGGLLACILPASWLSSTGHKKSRLDVDRRCSVFEVWRLPRDLFREARHPSAVVFAQKLRTVQRSNFAFRWVTASKAHRESFLDRGAAQFQSTEIPPLRRAFTGGPVDVLAASGITVEKVAIVTSGQVQTGKPCPVPSGEGTPVLARGTKAPIHRSIGRELITWVADPRDNFRLADGWETILDDSPKLLVQANRFQDNAWRLRPILDTTGVLPSNSWQTLSGKPQTIWALNAFLSTSIASCFVHSHSTTGRIRVDLLEEIPLPAKWTQHYEKLFAVLGEQMAEPTSDLASLVDKAELLAYQAFELDDAMKASIQRVMAEYKAPDGRVRFPEVVEREIGDARLEPFSQAPGTVLGVERTSVQVWVLGGPDDGYTVDLHEGIPGWLLKKDATFELTGHPDTGRYRFHRSAHLSDYVALGMHNGLDPATSERSNPQ